MSSNIPPELYLFSEHFDITKALKCKNIYLPYPKAKTYENIADWYSKTYCKKKSDGLSKKALQMQRVVLKRNYEWFYQTLGLNVPRNLDEEKRYFKCIKKKRNSYGKFIDFTIKVESPDKLEPMKSSKIIFKPSNIRNRKYGYLRSRNKSSTDVNKKAAEISLKSCSPLNTTLLENSSLNIDDPPISNPLDILCQLIKPISTPQRTLQTINDYNNKITKQVFPYNKNGRDTSVNYGNMPVEYDSVKYGKENVFCSQISSSSSNNSHPMNKTQLPGLISNESSLTLPKTSNSHGFNVPLAYNLRNRIGNYEYHTVLYIVGLILDHEEKGYFQNYEEYNPYPSNSSETLYSKRKRESTRRLHKVIKLKIKEIPEEIKHLVKTVCGRKMIRLEDITPDVIPSLQLVAYEKKDVLNDDKQNSEAKTEHSRSVVNNQRDTRRDTNMPSVKIIENKAKCVNVNEPITTAIAKKNDSDKSSTENIYQKCEETRTSIGETINENKVQEDMQDLFKMISDSKCNNSVISLTSELPNQKLVLPSTNLDKGKKVKNSQVTISEIPCGEKKHLIDEGDFLVKSNDDSTHKAKNSKRKNRAERNEEKTIPTKEKEKLEQPSEIRKQPIEFNDQPNKKVKITNEKPCALKNCDVKQVRRMGLAKKVCKAGKKQVFKPSPANDLVSQILQSMQTPYTPKLQDESLEDTDHGNSENEEFLDVFNRKIQNTTLDRIARTVTKNSDSCLTESDFKNERCAKVIEMESPVIIERIDDFCEVNNPFDLKKDNFLKMNDSVEKKISVACKITKTCNKEKSLKQLMQYSDLLKQARNNMNPRTCSTGENKDFVGEIEEFDLVPSLKNHEVIDNSALSKNMASSNDKHILPHSETMSNEKAVDLNSGVRSITSSDNDKCSKVGSIDSKSDTRAKIKKSNAKVMLPTKQDSEKSAAAAKSSDDDLNHKTTNEKKLIGTEKQKIQRVMEDQEKTSELFQTVVSSSKDVSSQNLDKNVSLNERYDFNRKTNKKKHNRAESNKIFKDERKTSEVCQAIVPQSKDVSSRNPDKNVELTKFSDEGFNHEIIDKNKYINVQKCKSKRIEDQGKTSEVFSSALPPPKYVSCQNSDKNVALAKLSDNNFNRRISDKSKTESESERIVENQEKTSKVFSSSKDVSSQNLDNEVSFTKVLDNDFYKIPTKNKQILENLERDGIIDDQLSTSKIYRVPSSADGDSSIKHTTLPSPTTSNVLNSEEGGNRLDKKSLSKRERIILRVPKAILYGNASPKTTDVSLNNTTTNNSDGKRKKKNLSDSKLIENSSSDSDVSTKTEKYLVKQDLHCVPENSVLKHKMNPNIPDSQNVLCEVSDLNTEKQGSTPKVSEFLSTVESENKGEMQNSSECMDANSGHVSRELSLLELARKARNRVRTKV